VRARLIFSLPVLALLCSCAGPRIAPHYSAPSVAPIRSKIADARASLVRAAEHAGKTRLAILALKDFGPRLPTEAEISFSQSLSQALKENDALTQELEITQTALAASDKNAQSLQTRVETLAKNANTEATERSKAQAHDAATSRRYHTVKLYFCSAAAALALLLAFQFRWLLALLGPWGTIAGLAGLPALTFGTLWLWL